MDRVCGRYVIINPYTFVENACVEFSDRIKEIYEEDPIPEDFKNTIVSHGLPSTHTHLGLYPIRYSLLTRLELDDWVKGYVWPWERLIINNPELSYYSSILALAELVRSGVTAVADMHFNEDKVLRAAMDAGVRVDLSVAIMSRGVFHDIDEPLKQNKALVRLASDPDLREWVKVRYGPCTPRLLTPDEFAEVVSKAVDDGVGIHTHLAEVPEDEEYLVRNYGLTLGDFIDYVGLSRVNALVAHAIWVHGAIDRLARADGVTLIHSPRSNTLLRDGVMPVSSLIDSGVSLSLGVDVAPTYSVIDEMNFMLGLHYQGDSGVSPEDVLSMCLNGYRSMGFGSGILEEGEVSDLVVWSLVNHVINGCAVINPSATIVLGLARVRDVIIGGKYVVKEGEMLTLRNKVSKASEVVSEYIRTWLRDLVNPK